MMTALSRLIQQELTKSCNINYMYHYLYSPLKKIVLNIGLCIQTFFRKHSYIHNLKLSFAYVPTLCRPRDLLV